MHFTTKALFATLVAALAVLAVDPSTLSNRDKSSWCAYQKNFCINLCKNITSVSPKQATCDSGSLSWNCVCSDGKTPDSDVWTFPIVYYTCNADVEACQAKTCKKGDALCYQQCQLSKNCTAINDPFKGKEASSSDSNSPSTASNTDGSSGGSDGNLLGAATPSAQLGNLHTLMVMLASAGVLTVFF
ncbi:hypothetical protein GQ42DRAFT_15430 [Ramicandelaber brevisporus]|nr:hypothetical protein GQ42DRAFT_15430 [Ramicandelaber brevisporus]